VVFGHALKVVGVFVPFSCTRFTITHQYWVAGYDEDIPGRGGEAFQMFYLVLT
jgi:predicted glycosyltransferase involved in capsule biosynthesis